MSSSVSMAIATCTNLEGTTRRNLAATLDSSSVSPRAHRLVDDAGEPKRKVVNCLAVTEDDALEITAQLLRVRLVHPAGAHLLRGDRVPCSLGILLFPDSDEHVRWQTTQDGDHGAALLMVGRIPGGDGLPPAMGLEVHLHQQRPLRVVGVCQHREGAAGGRLLHHLLHDQFTALEAGPARAAIL